MWVISTAPVVHPDTVFVEGENLKKLLNKHKLVWKEVETKREGDKFKSYSYEVGGDKNE